jgi:peroxiredoxin
MNRACTTLLFTLALLTPPIAKALEVGDTLNIHPVQTLDGQTLSQEALKDKYLVIQIWASWCPYCHNQNLNLKKLVDETKGSQIQVVGLSIDKTLSAAEDYAKKHSLNFPVGMMPAELSAKIGKLRGIPTLYVIDPQGKVVQKDVGEMVDLDVFELNRYGKKL